jgi:hypothetical protein
MPADNDVQEAARLQATTPQTLARYTQNFDRKRPMRYRLLSVCLAAGFLATSPRASAESVALTFTGAVNPAVSLSGNPSGPYTPTGPFFWNQAGLPQNPNFPSAVTTFCIQTTGALPTGLTPAVFGVMSLTDVSYLGAAKANSIQELYGRFYNPAWENMAYGSSANSLAFQLALWEIVTDGAPAPGNTTDLANGAFTASSAIDTSGFAPVSTAQAMLNALNGDASSFGSRFGGSELVALVSPDPNGPKDQNWQDQIVMRPVPAPPGLVLAGIGFVGLLGRARWARRKRAN